MNRAAFQAVLPALVAPLMWAQAPVASPVAATRGNSPRSGSLLVLRDPNASQEARLNALANSLSPDSATTEALIGVLIEEVDRAARALKDRDPAGYNRTAAIRRALAAQIANFRGPNGEVSPSAIAALGYYYANDPLVRGTLRGPLMPPSQELSRLAPQLKPVLAHSALRLGVLWALRDNPVGAQAIQEEAWTIFQSVSPADRPLPAEVLITAGAHTGDVLKWVEESLRGSDQTLSRAAGAVLLPSQGKISAASADLLTKIAREEVPVPAAIRTLCHARSTDETLKQILFRALLRLGTADLDGPVGPEELSSAFFEATPEAITPLLEGVVSSDPMRRRRAVQIFQHGFKFPRPPLTAKVVPALQRALADGDVEVRCRAAQALAFIGAEAAAAKAALIAALRDPEPPVRHAAAAALELCSTQDALAEIERAGVDRPTVKNAEGDHLSLLGFDPPILPAMLGRPARLRAHIVCHVQSKPRVYVSGSARFQGSIARGCGNNGMQEQTKRVGVITVETVGRPGSELDELHAEARSGISSVPFLTLKIPGRARWAGAPAGER